MDHSVVESRSSMNDKSTINAANLLSDQTRFTGRMSFPNLNAI